MSIKEKYHNLRDRISSLREERLWFRVITNKYFIATFVFFIWMAFLDNNNIGVWYRTRRHLREQAARIEQLQEGIRQKEDRLDHLRSHRDSLEKFAREEYFFHEDGEDVYIVK